MTQSGQGGDPRHPQAGQPQAREGIVLPADGSAPLLPGTAGVPAAAGPPASSAPAEGSPWGGPWGPGAGVPDDTPQPAAPAQSWGDGQWTGTHANTQYAGALPPEAPAGPGGTHGRHAGPLPPAEAGHQLPPAAAPQLPPAGPESYGAPGHDPYQGYQGYQPGEGYPQDQGYQPTQSYPQDQGYQPDQAHQLPPAQPQEGPRHGAPRPVADEAATQYIPPVGAGALPPEGAPAEATAYLGPVPGQAPHQAAPYGEPHGPDEQATQYIAPVPVAGLDEQPTQYLAPVQAEPEGPRQPPAEFDSLFRTQPANGGGGASTQQLPRFEPPGRPGAGPGGPQQQPYGAPVAPQYQDDGAGRDGGGRRGAGGGGRSKGPMIAAAGVAIVLLGVGAGALLSGGGDDGGDQSKNVSATAPAGGDSPSPSADPAKAQATELDKLLGDSNNSRDTVITSVAHVQKCAQLDRAAADLRSAAKQRDGLSTRLGKLAVDQLPEHDALTSALDDAWKASASADNHYAAWADQLAGNKKQCKGGHAHRTGQAAQGDKNSGDATKAKNTAAELWNKIADKYGLTRRQPSQL